jgi:hypothetical protein
VLCAGVVVTHPCIAGAIWTCPAAESVKAQDEC